MSDLISRLSVKDRASEYAFSADEYERFCEIIDSSDDWLDAKVDGVSVEGIPLDGHYLDHLINYL